jgi:hypothetical protein
MTSLRHVFWNLSSLPAFIDTEAMRLSNLISHAPNLISLSVSTAELNASIRIRNRSHLKTLTTREYQDMLLHTVHSDIPNLVHIITTPNALGRMSSSKVFSVLGQQLKVIEFLEPQSLKGQSYNPIAHVLRRCPNLDTLSYNVNHVALFTPNVVLHPSLRSIVLRIDPRLQDNEALRLYLPRHFDILTGMSFPALRQVVFEGIVNCLFKPSYAVMRSRFPMHRVNGADIVWEC